MRPMIYAAVASFALAAMVGQVEAMPIAPPGAVPTNVEQRGPFGVFFMSDRGVTWSDGRLLELALFCGLVSAMSVLVFFAALQQLRREG